MALPLTGPSTPIQESKQPKHHDLEPVAQTSNKPAKPHRNAVAYHGKTDRVAVHNQVNKEQAHEIIKGLESGIPVAAHKQKCEYKFETYVSNCMPSADILDIFFQDEHPPLEDHVKAQAAAELSDHGEVSHAHSRITKGHTNDMITGVQNGMPVVNLKPKSE